MSGTTFFIKEADTGPDIVESLYDGHGNPIVLTGATVKFSLLSLDTNVVKINKASATITDAAHGIVTYGWGGTDTDTPGTYAREWQCTLQSGDVVTVPNSEQYLVVILPQIA